MSINGISTASTTTNTSTAATTAAANSFDADSFLTLLIAELQNQDPMNPMDSQQMVAQLATMEMVSETRANRQSQDMMQATGMLGRNVTWQNSETGLYSSGEVTGVMRDGSDARVLVGDVELKLDEILAIS